MGQGVRFTVEDSSRLEGNIDVVSSGTLQSQVEPCLLVLHKSQGDLGVTLFLQVPDDSLNFKLAAETKLLPTCPIKLEFLTIEETCPNRLLAKASLKVYSVVSMGGAWALPCLSRQWTTFPFTVVM